MRDIVETLPTDSFEPGLAFSEERADAGLPALLALAESKGWAIFPLAMVREISPVQDLKSGAHLRRLLKEYRPDILHCHSSKAGALGRLATQGVSPSIKTIYSPHALAAKLGWHYLAAERLLGPLSDKFVAVSESERCELFRYKVALKGQVDVVYPTIDNETYSPQDRNLARIGLGIPLDAKLLVGVGRLTEQKNPLLFIEVLKHTANKFPLAQGIWLGEGELRNSVEEAARNIGLTSRMHFASWQADVRPYLAAADLLLSTSKYESFGYMVAEALAMERPAVASAVTGTTDVLSGELMPLLYGQGDARWAARIVEDILRNPDKALDLGQIGRRHIQSQFSPDRMKECLTACYKSLLVQNPVCSTSLEENVKSSNELC